MERVLHQEELSQMANLTLHMVVWIFEQSCLEKKAPGQLSGYWVQTMMILTGLNAEKLI